VVVNWPTTFFTTVLWHKLKVMSAAAENDELHKLSIFIVKSSSIHPHSLFKVPLGSERASGNRGLVLAVGPSFIDINLDVEIFAQVQAWNIRNASTLD
jgi:hypothetical protein